MFSNYIIWKFWTRLCLFFQLMNEFSCYWAKTEFLSCFSSAYRSSPPAELIEVHFPKIKMTKYEEYFFNCQKKNSAGLQLTRINQFCLKLPIDKSKVKYNYIIIWDFKSKLHACIICCLYHLYVYKNLRTMVVI